MNYQKLSSFCSLTFIVFTSIVCAAYADSTAVSSPTPSPDIPSMRSTPLNQASIDFSAGIEDGPLLTALAGFLVTLVLAIILIRNSSQLAEFERQISKLQTAEKRAKKVIETQQGQHTEALERLTTQLEEAHRSKANAEQNLEQLKADKKAEASSLIALKAELKEKTQFIRNLNEQLSDKAETIGTLKAKIADQEALTLELSNAQQIIADLQEHSAKVHGIEHEKEAEALNHQIDELIHKLNKKEQDCQFLEDQVGDLQEELDALSYLRSSNAALASAAAEENEALEEEDLDKIASLTDSLTEAEYELESQEQIIADLYDTLNKVRNENDDFKTQLRHLQNGSGMKKEATAELPPRLNIQALTQVRQNLG